MTVLSQQNIKDLEVVKKGIERSQRTLYKIISAIEFRNDNFESLMNEYNKASTIIDGIDEFINRSEFVFGANRKFKQNH